MNKIKKLFLLKKIKIKRVNLTLIIESNLLDFFFELMKD